MQRPGYTHVVRLKRLEQKKTDEFETTVTNYKLYIQAHDKHTKCQLVLYFKVSTRMYLVPPFHIDIFIAFISDFRLFRQKWNADWTEEIL